jgi:putative Holliday junction resolvase
MNKYLGIDYGSKRIGLAISDEGGAIAFPLRVIANNLNTLKELKEILEEEAIKKIVIGKSENNDGKDNIISSSINQFIFVLKKEFSLPLIEEKEFFTSMHATETKGKKIKNARQTKFTKNQNLDARAAALILQRYLDRKVKK